MPAPFPELIDALQREIAETRRKYSSHSLAIENGTRSGVAGNDTVYVFKLKGPAGKLRPDSPICFRYGGRDITGMLVSVDEDEIRVALSEDLGETVAEATLVVDDVFLLDRLKSTLVELRDGNSKLDFNQRAASAILSNNASRIAEGSVPDEVFQTAISLNSEQRRAVRLCMGSTLLYLWGPPGTGKTLTLAAMANALFRQGKSVLIVSNTNAAVDAAIERIGDGLATVPEFHTGCVIRHGPILSSTLKKKYDEQVNLDAIVERLSRPVHEEQQRLNVRRSGLRVEVEELETLVAHHERSQTLSKRKDELESQHRRATQTVNKNKQKLDAVRKRLCDIQQELERARRMSGLGRFFRGISVESLRQKISRMQTEQQAFPDAIKAAEKRADGLSTSVHEAQYKYRQCLKELDGKPSFVESRQSLSRQKQELDSAETRFREIQQELEEIRGRVLHNCRILGTTVYQSYLNKNVARPYDVVIIDEASMLNLPLVFFASGLAKERVVVGGDFRQLPPIVKNDNDEVCREWLKKDVFFKAGIVSRIQTGNPAENVVSLTVQYRMTPAICDLVSTLAYQNRLSTSPVSVDEPLDISPFSGVNSGLVYVDTAKWKPWVAKPIGSHSRYNPFHALLIRNIILEQASRGLFGDTGEFDQRVGIVSPYNAQSRLITQAIQEAMGRPTSIFAATVHRFQGNERDIIICEISDSDGCYASKFVRSTSINEDGSRLLNVALSRAKQCLLLVANFTFLRAKLPRDAFIRKTLDFFVDHGQALTVDNVLPSDIPEKPSEEKTVSGPAERLKTRVFTQQDFYKAFRKDCEDVAESLVVFSPFVTRDGVQRWYPHWDRLTAEEKAVRVVTRPAGENVRPRETADELVGEMRRRGITVDLRAGMHQKVAFIDNRFVWHGSLNILSHRDASESMLRIEAPALLEQIGRNLTIARSQAPDLTRQENPICDGCDAVSVFKDNLFRCEKCGKSWDRHCNEVTQAQPSTEQHDTTGIAGRWTNESDWKGKAKFRTVNGVVEVAIISTREVRGQPKLTLAFTVNTPRGRAVPPDRLEGFEVSRNDDRLSGVEVFG